MRRYIAPLAPFALLALALPAFSAIAGTRVFEKGDALYRPLKSIHGTSLKFGHAAIYVNSNAQYALSAEDVAAGTLTEIIGSDDQHSVIEAPGYFEGGVKIVSFNTFLGERSYWGAYEPIPGMDPLQRYALVLTAGRKVGTPYTMFFGWKGPNQLRCDGLVRLAYASIGVNIPSKGEGALDSWITNLPRTQRDQLSLRISALNPPCRPTIRTQMGLSMTTVNDYVADGSGIDRVEFYNGQPETNGALIGKDDHDSNTDAGQPASNTYSIISTIAPTTNLFSRIVDQSGNYTTCTAGGQAVATSDLDQAVPTIVEDTTPPSIGGMTATVQPGGQTLDVKWTASDDSTATADLFYIFAFDKPIDQWDDSDVNFIGTNELQDASLDITGLNPAQPHTLTLAVVDQEGNINGTSVESLSFKGPPLFSLSDGFSNSFQNVFGIQTLIRTTQLSSLSTNTMQFTFDSPAGLKSISVTMPNGGTVPITYTPPLANPASISSDVRHVSGVFHPVTLGRYTITATTQDDAITSGSVDAVNLGINLLGSSNATFDQGTNLYTASLAFACTAEKGLDRVELAISSGPSSSSNHCGTVDLVIPNDGGSGRSLTLVAVDKDGNSYLSSLSAKAAPYSPVTGGTQGLFPLPPEPGSGTVSGLSIARYRGLPAGLTGNGTYISPEVSVSTALFSPFMPVGAFGNTNNPPVLIGATTAAPSGLPLPIATAGLTLGSVEVSVLTEGGETTVYSGDITYSTAGVLNLPVLEPTQAHVKGSYQVKVLLHTDPQGSILSGNCRAQTGNNCTDGDILVPSISGAGQPLAGLNLEVFAGPQAGTLFSEPETGVSAELGFGASVEGLRTVPGAIFVTLGGKIPDLGYKGIPANAAFDISAPAGMGDGGFTLNLPFDPTGLTGGQLAKLKVVRIQGDGNTVDLPVGTYSFNSDHVSLHLTSFGRFMIMSPVYPEPVEDTFGAMTIMHDASTVVTGSAANTAEPSLHSMIVGVRASGQESFGGLYQLPHGLVFNPPAVIRIAVSPEDLAAKNASASDQTLYELSPETGRTIALTTVRRGAPLTAEALLGVTSSVFGAFSPPSGGVVVQDVTPPITDIVFTGSVSTSPASPVYATTSTLVGFSSVDPPFALDLVSGVATTYFLLDQTYVNQSEIPPTPYGQPFSLPVGSHTLAYFSIDRAGNTELTSQTSFYVTYPGATDVKAPRTALQLAISSTSAEGTSYVNGATRFVLSTQDDRLVADDGLGVGTTQTFYAVDSGSYTRYTSSFTIAAEGLHALSFYSVDLVGNTETPIQKSVFSDQTPPVTQLIQDGATFSLSAVDPANAGGASGVKKIHYLLEINNPSSCDGIPEDTGSPRGTCQNPWYGGPFTLTNGNHTISFQSYDGAGNVEALQTAHPNVATSGSGPSVGGLGIGRDIFDAFWSVNSENEFISFVHSNSSGSLISSTTLADAINFGVPWSVFFDPSGRAYAVGDAAGQALDLAIYKANSAGDAVESRALFDSGYANNDLIFDAKAPGWIVGAAQTSGPTDPEAEGERSFSLALWKFDSALGSVSLSTITGRAGFDLGSGVAVDTDGSLWIIGYSLRPDASAVGGFDLSLRHYASDGHTLLGGPFLLPGYLSDVNESITAKAYVSAAAVYVAAPRIKATGGTDMAFIKFDKATGVANVEKIWRSGDGASSYPVAILPDASGLLVAGGIGSNFADAALWRFGFDGSFISATTVDAGGARSAVLRGTQIWLSVDGSSSPYLVQAEAAAPGAIIDISTPAAPGAALAPSTGPIGIPFTISGTGFGPYAGANTRVKFGATAAPLSVWNDTTISGTVPGLSSGAYAVTIERQNASSVTITSAGSFTVTVPAVASVTPSSGPIGSAFTLSGQSFGPYAGTLTQVLIGGATAPLSVWNDAQIAGTVPGSLAPGVYPLIVERRTSDGGLSQANTAYFQVLGLIANAVTPSSGPIGVPFTINGEGFGAYAGANTRVKFGATLAALSVWNDTTITGTIPALDTGAWTVTVERQQGSDVSSVSAGTFTATALAIASISPSSGPIGTVFTLLGPGFGPYAGSLSVVLIDGATAALSVWNDAKIVGTIPGSIPAGVKTVVVRRFSGAGVSSSEAASFEVTGMTLATITPSSGPIGSPFTITGSQFGVYGGANTRVKFGGVSAALSVWNDSTITGTIPALPTGAVDVVVERQQGSNVSMSNISSFTILGLTVSSMTPSEGPIGVPFTIKGSGFGPYAGANTRALIGGVSAALSMWNDTTISGTIPNLAPGSQPVWLERSAGTGVTSSATSYFNVTVPAVATLTPSSAPIGAPFTITGSNFGPYAGTNTRVKIGGVAAPLSVWNDTQISGTVPGSLSPGAVELVVERVAGAGLTASATQAFSVLLPVISTISPAFGPAGTVVTMTGHGFGPYAGTLTKVLVGGATVPLSVWNDATIRWTVPASLADGDYPVIVERAPAGGTVDSASATFTVGTGFGGASFGFAAVQSLAAKPDSHFEGDLSLSSTTGGRIDTPAKAAVEIPPNAMEADTEITLKRAHGDGLRVRAAEDIKKRAAGEPIEFGPEGTRFATPVTIELPYDPALTADETKLAIHYFNPLTRAWEELPSEVDRARHVVKAKTDHFSIYQPMGLAPTTVAHDEFYFRDQYAFPNPSRGGSLITFRIQPGLAETVEVRVYDLSGRKVHSSSDFTFLGAVDDGNGKGAQNTYDHAWSVNGVGSGVYTYVIKASQRGQKPITKSGKVGVIR